jgi:nitrogen fixation protein NifU and related proteins
MENFDQNIQAQLANPQNQGEMKDADAVGTVGSPDCGDMMRLWLKFTEKNGQRVIDRASFQAFGCQTAIAVATVATRLLQGKTPEQARNLSAQELAADLGTLPPMKIHCGQLVEGALRNALDSSNPSHSPQKANNTLLTQISKPNSSPIKIIPLS